MCIALKEESPVLHDTYTGTQDVKCMNQSKVKTIKKELEHLNIAVLGVSELKQTTTYGNIFNHTIT